MAEAVPRSWAWPLKIALSNLKIIDYPDPVLQRRCARVEQFDEHLARVAERMLELMRAGNGVGLAAPQVGLNMRMFVCNVTPDATENRVYVNPQFLDLQGSEVGDEGCLSLPGVTVAMRRAESAVMEAFGLDGRRVEVEASGLLARVWQHESDHLDGTLIIDHMSEADAIANRRALRQLRASYKPRRGK